MGLYQCSAPPERRCLAELVARTVHAVSALRPPTSRTVLFAANRFDAAASQCGESGYRLAGFLFVRPACAAGDFSGDTGIFFRFDGPLPFAARRRQVEENGAIVAAPRNRVLVVRAVLSANRSGRALAVRLLGKDAMVIFAVYFPV
jgi:hypothetical protein